MSKTLLVVLASLLALGAMTWTLVHSDLPAPELRTATGTRGPASEVMLFCAASNRAVMEDIRQEYESVTGRKVVIQYGASQTLLSQMEVTGTGDLYLPADDSFLDMARDKHLVAEVLPIATMQCVVAVRKGNPLNIRTLRDLLSDRVRLVQANPDAAAVARLTRSLTQQLGLWNELDAATTAYRTTVTDVANDVLVGAADAGIVYDAVLHTYPDLEAVEVAELAGGVSRIAMGVIATTDQPAAALHFARFVAAADRGLLRYQAHGFQTSGGDVWSDVPELTLFAGSMLRPAIEDTVIQFEQREGVRVTRVYNGCGILVAQMKSGQQPDAYFACDQEFMSQVGHLFSQPVDVSQNELVILVQKGNPHHIASLQDLTAPGLRVGIGHEKQCAMGWITQNTFQESGLQSELMANVTVQTPTGDMLVNQLRTGSLDAAVVYLSNAAGAAEYLDAIQIQGIECSTATQPWAIHTGSQQSRLTARLFDHLTSTESERIFRAEGFRWRLSSKSAE